jgi:hypothetical protein
MCTVGKAEQDNRQSKRILEVAAGPSRGERPNQEEIGVGRVVDSLNRTEMEYIEHFTKIERIAS